jgi:hypothetical protein
VAALAASGAVVAAASEGESAGNKLAGTWTVTVNRPAPLPPLTSLQVFTDDGSVIEMANEAQATRTAAYGSWERVGGRLYASTMVFFRFNPQTGAHVATQKINRTIELSEDGQTFVHAGQATVYDPSGNVVTTFPVSASAARMAVERIDVQP